ncbi:hypothetical protein BSKO_10843 [Bryopsis sp. KO-2023]|nr:hypothetical protein BSKO_10843 [Bryopsis sp. KO-2023]
MAKIVLYSTSVPLTLKLKNDIDSIKFLLEVRKLDFEEVDLAVDTERKEEMMGISGIKTLPQLMVNGKFVGDAQAIQELQDFNELTPVLTGEVVPPQQPS